MSGWADLEAAVSRRRSAAQAAAASSAAAPSSSEAEFLAAADKLQARLCLGVKAEMDANKDALLRLYRRCASLL